MPTNDTLRTPLAVAAYLSDQQQTTACARARVANSSPCGMQPEQIMQKAYFIERYTAENVGQTSACPSITCGWRLFRFVCVISVPIGDAMSGLASFCGRRNCTSAGNRFAATATAIRNCSSRSDRAVTSCTSPYAQEKCTRTPRANAMRMQMHRPVGSLPRNDDDMIDVQI